MSTQQFEQDDQQKPDDAQDQAPEQEEESFNPDEAVDSAFMVPKEKQPLSKGTVAMFVILAIAGAGTYLMYLRTGPQSASAATDPKAQQVIKQFMNDRNKNPAALQKMLEYTESVMKQFRNYPSVNHVPLSSNPFKMASESGQKPTPADDSRERKQREEEKAAIAKAAAELQLQSVMHSDKNKSCMINNTLYREGQQIDAFTIEKISPHTVIVRSGIYRFQLSMQGK
jgi:hypothetical protein